ncbi:MAG: hypothetical protein U9N45_07620, partial [Gemmatimonadota bacterium]|nr:hypothetical protein [Gemmatimonadota bacterium]
DQGKLILDFGQVNEDQVRFDRSSQLVGLHQLQTEDRNFDGRLDHDEDTGLDQVPGADPPPGAAGQVVEGDDGNDDFYRTKENEWPDGRWLNLTEGNNRGQIGSSFDTEDLNNNGALDEQENVFRLILDLETLELVPPPGIFIPEEDRHVIKEEVPFVYDSEGKRIRDVSVHALGEDSWYLLEIPLPKDNTRFEQYYQKINSPSLSKVMHVRLTLHDFEKRDTVNFAAINFVGNRFKKAEEGVVPRLIETFVDTFPSDTLWPGPGLEEPLSPEETPGLMSAVGHHGTVDISSINTIFNNEYYPPPLVSATLNKYNRSGRQEDFTAQESAINVGYWDLQRNYEGWALKAENNQQSYLDYAAMSFYVNGRQGVNDPKPTLFIRIGTDRENFYEYSTQVDTGWTEITVPFNGFLSLKDSIQGELSLLDIQQSDLNVKRGPFRIKGNPSLTKVAVMAIGVANETSDIPITGNVWVDDVRLTDVIREFGINSRVQIEAQLSDLGRINFSVNARDNKFRNLNESIPRNSTFDYTIGGSLNLERFTPEKWGLRIPVNMRRSYRRNLPRFHPGSEDVTIQLPENKEKNKTETTSSSFSISYSKRKGTSKLSRYIFDNLKGSLSMRNSRTIAPKNMSSNKGVSGRLTYRATLPREAEVGVIPGRVSGFLNKVPLPYFLKTNTLTKGLADMKFRYMPNDFELSVVGDYKRRTRYNPVSSKFQLDSTFTTTNGARVSYRPFVSMQNTYDIQVKRNMLESARGTKILGFNIGEETARRQGVNMQFAPKAVPWLQPNYTYRANYTMDHSPQYVLSFPKGTNYRKFNTNITQTLGIRFMLPQFRQSLVGVRFTDPARKKKKDDGDKKEQSSSAAYKRKGRPQGKGPSGKGIVGKFVFDPINKFIDSFDPVSFQMTKGSKDRWEQMEKTPGFLYQIGLNDLDIASRLRRNAKDPTKIDTADFNSMGWNFTRAYQSGMRILQTRLSASYIERGTNNHNLNGYTFNRETGPELTFDYSNIPLPLFMRSYISRMDVASGYTLKKGFRGNSVKISEENPTGLESQTREERWNPKYRVTTDLGSTGKVRTRYQKNSSVKTDELVGQNRRAITESEDESFNLQYSFSAPRGLRLPFLKNLKLKSNVRTSLDVRRRISRNMTEVFDELGNVVDVKINRDVEDISLTPTLSYDFAQVIGNLSASYTSHKDRKTGTTRITINMKVSVQLDF